MTTGQCNAKRRAHLIRLLLDGDRSCEELAEETGLHYVTVLEFCRELKKAGALYVAKWDKDIRDRDIIKVYRLGIGKDAKRSKLTDAQKKQKSRARQREANKLMVLGGLGQYVASRNGRFRFERHDAK